MNPTLDQRSIAQLFTQARTQNAWRDEPVSDSQLRDIYDLVKMGPTSMNTQPARLLFLRSRQAKERLRPALSSGNVDKTMQAPVVAIVAHDIEFQQNLPKTFPHQSDARNGFDGDEKRAFRETFAFRNGSLQGAYLILAIRAVGLDAGPMSGFDNAKVDAEFFPDGDVRSNFLCSFGVGDPVGIKGPRLPRLSFDEACRVL